MSVPTKVATATNLTLTKQQPKKPKTIIAGAGPAGLNAALILLTKGHDVILIDNRSEFSRVQRVVITEDLIRSFFKLSNLEATCISLCFSESGTSGFVIKGLTKDNQDTLSLDLDYLFFKKLSEENCTIQIKDLQAYLKQKLEKSIAKGKTALLVEKAKPQDASDKKSTSDSADTKTEKDSQVVLWDNTGTVSFLLGSHEITALDGNNQTLTLKSKDNGSVQALEFDHFVSAEGACSEMSKLLQQSRPTCTVVYESLQPPPRHSAHGAIVLRLGAGVELPSTARLVISPHHKGSSKLGTNDLKLLSELGWTKDFHPVTYISRQGNTFYFTGEIPEGYTDAQLEKWAKEILAIEYQLKPQSFEREVRGFSSVFKLVPTIASSNVFTLGKNGRFFLIGDAFLRANYLFGHGVEDAISDSNALQACFSETGELIETTSSAMQIQYLKRKKRYDNLNAYFNSTMLHFNVDIATRAVADAKAALEHVLTTSQAPSILSDSNLKEEWLGRKTGFTSLVGEFEKVLTQFRTLFELKDSIEYQKRIEALKEKMKVWDELFCLSAHRELYKLEFVSRIFVRLQINLARIEIVTCADENKILKERANGPEGRKVIKLSNDFIRHISTLQKLIVACEEFKRSQDLSLFLSSIKHLQEDWIREKQEMSADPNPPLTFHFQGERKPEGSPAETEVAIAMLNKAIRRELL